MIYPILLTTLMGLLLAAGEKPQFVTLLPAANWQLRSREAWEPGRLRERGADPMVEREYGVERVERQRYELHGEVAEVFLEEAVDPSAAYGLLSFYSTPEMRAEKGMKLTMSSSELTLLARGRYFVRIPRPASKRISDSDFQALLITIAGLAPRAKSMQELPPPLPLEDLVPGSEKYVLGPYTLRKFLPDFQTDLVGFAQGAEAQLGQYRDAQGTATLLLISFPTPQMARIRFGALAQFLNLNADRGRESMYGRRSGSFLLLVIGADSGRSANRLLDRMVSSAQVTWSERPPQHKTLIAELIELVLSNFLLIGILAGMSIAAGAAIYLFRCTMQRYFPETFLGRPDGAYLIRLGLDRL